ncbi:MAG: HAMP domain-containing sensor histidine kinase [Flavobacterium sp.]
MKRKNYPYIILFITLTIVATIGLQVYWNMKNYDENKTRLINEVQIALDNSIESYYAEDVKNDFVAFVNNNKSIKPEDFINSIGKDSLFRKQFPKMKGEAIKKDSLKTSTFIQYKITTDNSGISNKKGTLDSIRKQIETFDSSDTIYPNTTLHIAAPKITAGGNIPEKHAMLSVFRGKKAVDSIFNMKDLANKIVISLTRDSIDFKKLNGHLKKELGRKNINVSYALRQYKSGVLFDRFEPYKGAGLALKTISKSTYLPKGQKLELEFSNPMRTILKRSMTEIILSFLLSLSIIGCLLYLLRTINKQKKLDEIKNDLISNITHEFKTPITTISSAIEGIRIFNIDNDPEKTKRYLSVSENQLKKLELMVEKLLETSTLETDKLTLKKEKTDLIDIITESIDKHRMICPDKEIRLQAPMDSLILAVDIFHFENVISNLIDNAIKYGGGLIRVSIEDKDNQITILVEDNGNGIEKKHKERIFEKFYRIPKGNVHDVKGFGIGLYYAKKIIEKHKGSLKLLSGHKLTTFKITLPNDN